jgi:uncharacterized metal-binding protein YceD (DUF177 family)
VAARRDRFFRCRGASGGPLKAEGVAELLPHSGEEVRVHGKVEAKLETECDRCLGRATFPVAASFDLFYKPVDPEVTAEEVAIDEGEAEMGFYELPGLVLEDILREQLLLQLPMQRVCSETCKGICPVCGANRNEVVRVAMRSAAASRSDRRALEGAAKPESSVVIVQSTRI